MNAEEFVNLIEELKPNPKDVKKYTGDFLNALLREFDAKKTNNLKEQNPIFELISNFSMDTLRIHDITFEEEVFEEETSFFIGNDSFGRLAIDKATSRIVCYDPYSDDVIFLCSEDSSKFLDALYEIMKFVKEKMLNDYDEVELNQRSSQIAYIASLKAGGDEYEDYYKPVLGVE